MAVFDQLYKTVHGNKWGGEGKEVVIWGSLGFPKMVPNILLTMLIFFPLKLLGQDPLLGSQDIAPLILMELCLFTSAKGFVHIFTKGKGKLFPSLCPSLLCYTEQHVNIHQARI